MSSHMIGENEKTSLTIKKKGLKNTQICKQNTLKVSSKNSNKMQSQWPAFICEITSHCVVLGGKFVSNSTQNYLYSLRNIQ